MKAKQLLLRIAAAALLLTCGAAAGEWEGIRIGDEVVPVEEYQDFLLDRYGSHHLEEFILARQVERQAREAGVECPPEKLELGVRRFQADHLRQEYRGSLEAFRSQLRTLGLSLAEWQGEIRRRLRPELLAMELLRSRRDVDPEELQRLFERRHGPGGVKLELQHLLVSTDPSRSTLYSVEDHRQELPVIEQRARVRLAAARARVEAGEAFAAVARDVSDDSSRTLGGDLGFHWQSRFPEPARERIRALAAGAVSQVLEVSSGLALARVTERRPHRRYRGHRILLAPGSLERANQLLGKLQQGSSFESLARRYSREKDTRSSGGRFTTVAPPAALVPALDQMAPEELRVVQDPEQGVWLVRLGQRQDLGEQLRVSWILAATDYQSCKRRKLQDKLPQLARERAAELEKQLEKGAELAELTREHSEDRSTRDGGGLLPDQRWEAWGPAAREDLLALQPGEHAIIRSPAGFHIVKLLEKDVTELDAVRPQLEEELRRKPIRPIEVEQLKRELLFGCGVVKGD